MNPFLVVVHHSPILKNSGILYGEVESVISDFLRNQAAIGKVTILITGGLSENLQLSSEIRFFFCSLISGMLAAGLTSLPGRLLKLMTLVEKT